MRAPWIALSMLALGCLACVNPRPTATPEPAGASGPAVDQSSPPEPAPGGPTIAATRGAIERALAATPGWTGLTLFTECRRDGDLEAIEIFGDGVGVWHGKRQFELTEERIVAILTALAESDFAAMPVSFGGKGGTAPPPLPGGDGSAEMVTTVVCRVRFAYDGVDKEVVQLEKGEQSDALRQLSETFFRECGEPARFGVEAQNLSDGLEKIAHGELAPQTFSLLLHYRPDSAPGFRLRIRGLEAITRPIQPGAGLQSRRLRRLSPAQLDGLARALALAAPESLPANLWAEDYTDLSLQVLDHRVTIQARQFAGLGPDTHGDAQLRFEAIMRRLTELEAEISAAGSG